MQTCKQRSKSESFTTQECFKRGNRACKQNVISCTFIFWNCQYGSPQIDTVCVQFKVSVKQTTCPHLSQVNFCGYGFYYNLMSNLPT